MGEALHILIALAAAALPVLVHQDERTDKLTGIMTLARWFLVVSAVHQEKLVGDREWWFSRPNSWKSLLGAKLLFLASFVQLPLLLSDLTILGANGLTPAWGRLAMREVQLAFTLILPAGAVAAITPGLVSCSIAILAMLMAIILPGATNDVTTNWGPLVWLPPVLVIFVLGISAVLILFWQYSRRQTIPAAGTLGAATVVCSVLFVIPPAGWAIALASHGVSAVEGVRVEWNNEAPPSLVDLKPGKVRLTLPVVFSGYPEDMLIQLDLVQLSLNAPDRPIWHSGWQAGYQSSTGWLPGLVFTDPRHAQISFLVDESALNRAANQPVSCDLSIVMSVLGGEQAQAISQVNGTYQVPGFGVCTPERRLVSYPFPVLTCRSSRPPTQEVVIRESGFNYSRPGDWMSNVSLTPSPVWSTAAGLPNDWTGGPITFRMRTPIARIRRGFVHPVRLGDYRQ
jgi:hypothetical protein